MALGNGRRRKVSQVSQAEKLRQEEKVRKSVKEDLQNARKAACGRGAGRVVIEEAMTSLRYSYDDREIDHDEYRRANYHLDQVVKILR